MPRGSAAAAGRSSSRLTAKMRGTCGWKWRTRGAQRARCGAKTHGVTMVFCLQFLTLRTIICQDRLGSHTRKSENGSRFVCRLLEMELRTVVAPGKKTHLLRHFYTKNDDFTKTGSGQNRGKTQKRDMRSLTGWLTCDCRHGGVCAGAGCDCPLDAATGCSTPECGWTGAVCEEPSCIPEITCHHLGGCGAENRPPPLFPSSGSITPSCLSRACLDNSPFSNANERNK